MLLKNSKFGMFYSCESWPRCKATHGAHPDGQPLGVPASTPTKRWRMEAHKAFDDFWAEEGRQRGWSKREARSWGYLWLERRMAEGRTIHIGEQNTNGCRKILKILGHTAHDLDEIEKKIKKELEGLDK